MTDNAGTSQQPARRRWLWDRPTGEILILIVTFTVCFGVLSSGFTVAMVAIFNPEADVSLWVARITGTFNTMLGVMAGFLAGRTDLRAVRRDDGPAE